MCVCLYRGMCLVLSCSVFFFLLSSVIRQVDVSGIASRMMEEPQRGWKGLVRGDVMKPNTRTVQSD